MSGGCCIGSSSWTRGRSFGATPISITSAFLPRSPAFLPVDLSAFYFDIRKDALYCDPYSSIKRRACLTVLDQLFRCTVIWLAPMLCFTAEEAWLARDPAATSVHLELFPAMPEAWRNQALAEKWRDLRNLRRVVTGALELERAAKRIGSSLEAAPIIYVADPELFGVATEVDLAELCITSGATLVEGEGPAAAFRLDDVPMVSVEPRAAEGANVPAPGKSRRRSAAIRNFPT